MFSVRLVKADHYMNAPISGLDVKYSEFRAVEVKQVPVIRIFGSTPSGQKVCVHVHGVFPYIYIPYDGLVAKDRFLYEVASGIDKALNISLGNSNSSTQHVYKITLVSAIPFYGYHSKTHQFLKIFFYNPLMVKKASDLLQNGVILGQIFQPHEAHIPFILQFCIDYNLHGMSFVHLTTVRYRQNRIEGSEIKIAPLQGVPEELVLPESILRLTTCNLEVDAVAADIINQKEISGNLARNPGLQCIWNEEKQRRRKEHRCSQFTPQNSQPRSAPITSSEVFHLDRLKRHLGLSTLLKENVEKILEKSFSGDKPKPYPAPTPEGENLLEASMLHTHLNSLNTDKTCNTSWQKSVVLKDRNVYIDEKEVLSITSSQDHLESSQSSFLNSQGLSLVHALRELVEDDSVLGSQTLAIDENHEEEVDDDDEMSQTLHVNEQEVARNCASPLRISSEEGPSYSTSPKIPFVLPQLDGANDIIGDEGAKEEDEVKSQKQEHELKPGPSGNYVTDCIPEIVNDVPYFPPLESSLNENDYISLTKPVESSDLDTYEGTVESVTLGVRDSVGNFSNDILCESSDHCSDQNLVFSSVFDSEEPIDSCKSEVSPKCLLISDPWLTAQPASSDGDEFLNGGLTTSVKDLWSADVENNLWLLPSSGDMTDNISINLHEEEEITCHYQTELVAESSEKNSLPQVSNVSSSETKRRLSSLIKSRAKAKEIENANKVNCDLIINVDEIENPEREHIMTDFEPPAPFGSILQGSDYDQFLDETCQISVQNMLCNVSGGSLMTDFVYDTDMKIMESPDKSFPSKGKDSSFSCEEAFNRMGGGNYVTSSDSITSFPKSNQSVSDELAKSEQLLEWRRRGRKPKWLKELEKKSFHTDETETKLDEKRVNYHLRSRLLESVGEECKELNTRRRTQSRRNKVGDAGVMNCVNSAFLKKEAKLDVENSNMKERLGVLEQRSLHKKDLRKFGNNTCKIGNSATFNCNTENVDASQQTMSSEKLESVESGFSTEKINPTRLDTETNPLQESTFECYEGLVNNLPSTEIPENVFEQSGYPSSSEKEISSFSIQSEDLRKRKNMGQYVRQRLGMLVELRSRRLLEKSNKSNAEVFDLGKSDDICEKDKIQLKKHHKSKRKNMKSVNFSSRNVTGKSRISVINDNKTMIAEEQYKECNDSLIFHNNNEVVEESKVSVPRRGQSPDDGVESTMKEYPIPSSQSCSSENNLLNLFSIKPCFVKLYNCGTISNGNVSNSEVINSGKESSTLTSFNTHQYNEQQIDHFETSSEEVENEKKENCIKSCFSKPSSLLTTSTTLSSSEGFRCAELNMKCVVPNSPKSTGKFVKKASDVGSLKAVIQAESPRVADTLDTLPENPAKFVRHYAPSGGTYMDSMEREPLCSSELDISVSAATEIPVSASSFGVSQSLYNARNLVSSSDKEFEVTDDFLNSAKNFNDIIVDRSVSAENLCTDYLTFTRGSYKKRSSCSGNNVPREEKSGHCIVKQITEGNVNSVPDKCDGFKNSCGVESNNKNLGEKTSEEMRKNNLVGKDNDNFSRNLCINDILSNREEFDSSSDTPGITKSRHVIGSECTETEIPVTKHISESSTHRYLESNSEESDKQEKINTLPEESYVVNISRYKTRYSVKAKNFQSSVAWNSSETVSVNDPNEKLGDNDFSCEIVPLLKSRLRDWKKKRIGEEIKQKQKNRRGNKATSKLFGERSLKMKSKEVIQSEKRDNTTDDLSAILVHKSETKTSRLPNKTDPVLVATQVSTFQKISSDNSEIYESLLNVPIESNSKITLRPNQIESESITCLHKESNSGKKSVGCQNLKESTKGNNSEIFLSHKLKFKPKKYLVNQKSESNAVLDKCKEGSSQTKLKETPKVKANCSAMLKSDCSLYNQNRKEQSSSCPQGERTVLRYSKESANTNNNESTSIRNECEKLLFVSKLSDSSIRKKNTCDVPNESNLLFNPEIQCEKSNLLRNSRTRRNLNRAVVHHNVVKNKSSCDNRSRKKENNVNTSGECHLVNKSSAKIGQKVSKIDKLKKNISKEEIKYRHCKQQHNVRTARKCHSSLKSGEERRKMNSIPLVCKDSNFKKKANHPDHFLRDIVDSNLENDSIHESESTSRSHHCAKESVIGINEENKCGNKSKNYFSNAVEQNIDKTRGNYLCQDGKIKAIANVNGISNICKENIYEHVNNLENVEILKNNMLVRNSRAECKRNEKDNNDDLCKEDNFDQKSNTQLSEVEKCEKSVTSYLKSYLNDETKLGTHKSGQIHNIIERNVFKGITNKEQIQKRLPIIQSSKIKGSKVRSRSLSCTNQDAAKTEINATNTIEDTSKGDFKVMTRRQKNKSWNLSENKYVDCLEVNNFESRSKSCTAASQENAGGPFEETVGKTSKIMTRRQRTKSLNMSESEHNDLIFEYNNSKRKFKCIPSDKQDNAATPVETLPKNLKLLSRRQRAKSLNLSENENHGMLMPNNSTNTSICFSVTNQENTHDAFEKGTEKDVQIMTRRQRAKSLNLSENENNGMLMPNNATNSSKCSSVTNQENAHDAFQKGTEKDVQIITRRQRAKSLNLFECEYTGNVRESNHKKTSKECPFTKEGDGIFTDDFRVKSRRRNTISLNFPNNELKQRPRRGSVCTLTNVRNHPAINPEIELENVRKKEPTNIMGVWDKSNEFFYGNKTNKQKIEHYECPPEEVHPFKTRRKKMKKALTNKRFVFQKSGFRLQSSNYTFKNKFAFSKYATRYSLKLSNVSDSYPLKHKSLHEKSVRPNIELLNNNKSHVIKKSRTNKNVHQCNNKETSNVSGIECNSSISKISVQPVRKKGKEKKIEKTETKSFSGYHKTVKLSESVSSTTKDVNLTDYQSKCTKSFQCSKIKGKYPTFALESVPQTGSIPCVDGANDSDSDNSQRDLRRSCKKKKKKYIKLDAVITRSTKTLPVGETKEGNSKKMAEIYENNSSKTNFCKEITLVNKLKRKSDDIENCKETMPCCTKSNSVNRDDLTRYISSNSKTLICDSDIKKFQPCLLVKKLKLSYPNETDEFISVKRQRSVWQKDKSCFCGDNLQTEAGPKFERNQEQNEGLLLEQHSHLQKTDQFKQPGVGFAKIKCQHSGAEYEEQALCEQNTQLVSSGQVLSSDVTNSRLKSGQDKHHCKSSGDGVLLSSSDRKGVLNESYHENSTIHSSLKPSFPGNFTSNSKAILPNFEDNGRLEISLVSPDFKAQEKQHSFSAQKKFCAIKNENGLQVITLMKSPPNNRKVRNSLKKLNLPNEKFLEPFFSDPSDVIERKDVGFKDLKINSLSVNELGTFESSIGVTGLEMYRLNAISNLWDVSQTSFDDPKNAFKNRNMKCALASHRETIITLTTSPPCVRKVKQWVKAREAYKDSIKEKNPEYKQVDLAFSIENEMHGTDKVALLNDHKKTESESDCKNTSTTLDKNDPSNFYESKFENKSLSIFSSPEDSISVISKEDLPEMKNLYDVHNLQDHSNANIEQALDQQKDQLSQFITPRVGIASISHDSLGYKLSYENLQDCRAVMEPQYLTILTVEIHIQTRGDLLPDPAHDSVCAVFYSVQNDVAENSLIPTSHTGMILVQRLTSDRNNRPIHSVEPECEIKYVSDERALMEEVINLVRLWDPDILAGYEVEMLSWGYLFERAFALELNLCSLVSRIPGARQKGKTMHLFDESESEIPEDLSLLGRIVLNVWRLMRHEVALQSYTFENVAFHVLHERVPLHSFKTLTQWWGHRTSIFWGRVVDHYLLRVLGLFRIINQLDLINRTSELARIFGIQFYEVLSRGSQFRVESMMLRLAKPMNYVPVSPSIQQRARMRAPEYLQLIMEPESKLYVDPVIVLDFQSLYPSMIIAYNYCFSTCLGRVEHLGQSSPFEFGSSHLRVPPNEVKSHLDNINISPCGVAFVKDNIRKGILPRMLEEILETRLMVKATMKQHKNDKTLQRTLHSRQLGLKLIANVTYGYTAANFSGRMACVEVADSVVSKGRETLERAIHLVQNTGRWGARVVYGDTDSLFVLVPGRSRQEAFEIGAEIAEAVTLDNPTPVKLKLEKVYQPCLLQTKKRYVGYMYESAEQKDPVYDAKGIETVRRDGCPAVAKILEKSLRVLFETKNVSKVKSYVQNKFTKLLESQMSLQDLIFAREYRGSNGYKPGACVPALELTKRWLMTDPRAEPRVSERVPYVIVSGAPNVPLIRLVRSPKELLMEPSLHIHAHYYISRVICPPLNRCFSLIGCDVLSWYTDLPRRKMLSLPKTLSFNEQRKKITISQYFSTSNCLICHQICQTGICSDCHMHPQKTCVILAEKLHNLERNVFSVEKICNSCCGFQDTVKCISLDCPVMYQRFKAHHTISQEYFLRHHLENLSS